MISRRVLSLLARTLLVAVAAFAMLHSPAADALGTPVASAQDAPGVEVPAPEGVPEVGDPVTAGDGDASITVDAPEGSSTTVLLVLLLTLGSVLPGLLLVCTTFPRFLIVLGLTRQALGLQTTPPNQLLAGLAAFLTLTVMGPVLSEVNDQGLQPALRGELETTEAIEAGWKPLQGWMLDHTRSSDIGLFVDLADVERPEAPEDTPARVLIPAFIISELRTAFIIGFLIWVPFLLIDLIVASVLSALGMLMMPPVVLSLPVKLALFVLVDGWALLVSSLVGSVG